MGRIQWWSVLGVFFFFDFCARTSVRLVRMGDCMRSVQGRVTTGHLVPENAYVAITCLRVADGIPSVCFRARPPSIK
jgi:hypothetical protein